MHDLAMIHHLLSLKVKKQGDKTPTEPTEGNFPSGWMKTGTCLAARNGSLLANSDRTTLPVSEAMHVKQE